MSDAEMDEMVDIIREAGKDMQLWMGLETGEHIASKVLELGRRVNGYRTVSSDDELDALPVGSIIKDQQGAMTKDGDDPRYPNWYVGDNAYEVRLPAIVLWEPSEGGAA